MTEQRESQNLQLTPLLLARVLLLRPRAVWNAAIRPLPHLQRELVLCPARIKAQCLLHDHADTRTTGLHHQSEQDPNDILLGPFLD